MSLICYWPSIVLSFRRRKCSLKGERQRRSTLFNCWLNMQTFNIFQAYSSCFPLFSVLCLLFFSTLYHMGGCTDDWRDAARFGNVIDTCCCACTPLREFQKRMWPVILWVVVQKPWQRRISPPHAPPCSSCQFLKCNDYVDGMVALGPPNATGPYIYHVEHGKRPTHPKSTYLNAINNAMDRCVFIRMRSWQYWVSHMAVGIVWPVQVVLWSCMYVCMYWSSNKHRPCAQP